MKKFLIFFFIFFSFFKYGNAENYIFNNPNVSDVWEYVNYNADLSGYEYIKGNNTNASIFCFLQKGKLVSYGTNISYTADIVLYNSNLDIYKYTNNNTYISNIVCDIDLIKSKTKTNFMTIKELQLIYELELTFLLLLTIIMIIVKLFNKKYKIKFNLFK